MLPRNDCSSLGDRHGFRIPPAPSEPPFSSENGNPFVRVADISPNRGISLGKGGDEPRNDNADTTGILFVGESLDSPDRKPMLIGFQYGRSIDALSDVFIDRIVCTVSPTANGPVKTGPYLTFCESLRDRRVIKGPCGRRGTCSRMSNRPCGRSRRRGRGGRACGRSRCSRRAAGESGG